jgi:hypothetical protein
VIFEAGREYGSKGKEQVLRFAKDDKVLLGNGEKRRDKGKNRCAA